MTEAEDPLSVTLTEQHARLRGIAYRMLGSYHDADDVVQEAWLRLQRQDPATIDNPAGWLTVVVSRLSLDLLRSRRSRPEDLIGDVGSEGRYDSADPAESPEDLAVDADAVGAALVVVLDTLGPAERLSFVLHDLFGLPFDQVAPIVGKSTAAARQLASRARRRVRGIEPHRERQRQQRVVAAFLAASRAGDFEALLRLLDPDVELRADARTVAATNANLAQGAPQLSEHLQGPDAVARAFTGRATGATPALIDGVPGLVWAPQGKALSVFALQVRGERIALVDVITSRDEIERMHIVLDDSSTPH